ncbi:TadE/TadG family type IV pilus assembly protein [Microvirga makkahensis]|uniref:Pilus assembly protein n=1 Tax=Microvirga makkahensis TaxID=1128670 RepID=A0A7X3MPA6_9HYPH|nr:TadE/TadG family type IV pilus assembly protein [Microvirga makkahensis]MXQ10688.1 pilus assembly protein [Microvirga makkahensis]
MKRIIRLLGSWRRDESGAAAIEFAIVGFVMILIMLGLVEFGRGLLVHNEIAYLADIGSRKVLIDPGIADDALQDEMREVFSKDDALLQIAISTEVIDEIEYRIIAVAYPMNLLVPSLSDSTLSLNVTRRVPVG